jgi:hypothetical protein
LWNVPAVIATTPVKLLTATGTFESAFAPFPKVPKPLFPQQRTVPPAINAHVCTAPAAIATTPVKLLTATGTFESVLVPFPNCPEPLLPQHWTEPPVTNAQVWREPAAIAMTPDRLLTATGTFESVSVPFPSSPSPLLPQQRTVPPATNAQVWFAPALIAGAPPVSFPDSDNDAFPTPFATTETVARAASDEPGANVTVNVHDLLGPSAVPEHSSAVTVKPASPEMPNAIARLDIPPSFVSANDFDEDAPTGTVPNEYGDDGAKANDGPPLLGLPSANDAVPVATTTRTVATHATVHFTRVLVRRI